MKTVLSLGAVALLLASCGNGGNKAKTEENQALKTSSVDLNYQVLKKINIGGEGGWDYAAFDTVNRRLFLSHSTKVNVIDVDKEQPVGEIPNTNGVHGIAFAYDLGKGYTSNGKDNSVTEFDLKSLKVLKTIPVTGENPDAILYDPFTHHVFTFNGKSSNATVIDANTGIVLATISLDGKPEFTASDNNGRVYVNIEDKNELTAINSSTNKVIYSRKLDSLDEPSAMSYDPTYGKLFIGAGNKKMAIVNAENGGIDHIYPIGDHVDAAGFNSIARNIFASCGDGTLWVMHQAGKDSCDAFATITTQKGARTLAVDSKKDRIYLPVADLGPMQAAEPGKKPRPSIVPGTFSVLVVGKK